MTAPDPRPPVPAAIVILAWLYLVTLDVLGVGAAVVWRWLRGDV